MIARMRGYSLLELTLVLVILSVMVIVGLELFPRLLRTEPEPEIRSQTNRMVDEALTGFVWSHGRLACPDTSTPPDGIEDCPADNGLVPWRSIGLAARPSNDRGLDLRYAIYRRPDITNTVNDVDLAMARDRYRPLLPSGNPPIAVATSLGNVNGIDLCHALRLGALAPLETARLHVGAGAAATNVAWVLVDPGAGDASGDGRFLDGSNATGLAFELPDRALASNYDDRVSVMDFNHLWSRLGCSAGFAAASHAQANNALTGAIMKRAIEDYKLQLELSVQMAEADVALSVASIAAGVGSTAGAAASTALALAEVATPPVWTPPGIAATPLAATAVVLAAAATVAAAVTTGFAAVALSTMQDRLNDLNNGYGGRPSLLTTSANLATRMRQNAERADQAGIHGQ